MDAPYFEVRIRNVTGHGLRIENMDLPRGGIHVAPGAVAHAPIVIKPEDLESNQVRDNTTVANTVKRSVLRPFFIQDCETGCVGQLLFAVEEDLWGKLSLRRVTPDSPHGDLLWGCATIVSLDANAQQTGSVGVDIYHVCGDAQAKTHTFLWNPENTRELRQLPYKGSQSHSLIEILVYIVGAFVFLMLYFSQAIAFFYGLPVKDSFYNNEANHGTLSQYTLFAASASRFAARY